MILGMSVQTFTFLHVVISVVGLVAGVVVVFGLIGGKVNAGWTAIFLIATVLTSATGFLFPLNGLTPALVTGLISSPILAIALFAIYIGKLAGMWRWVYVVSAVAALYFNFVALVAQTFLKVPIFHALAPTGSEPAFLIAQSVLLAIFIVLGGAAVIRFRPGQPLAA
jgi:hypothetical protein